MKRFVLIALGIGGVAVALPYAVTRLEERRLIGRNRLTSEVGYAIPDNSKIVDTSAKIWSLADGDNYSWTIESPESLLSWVQSVGTHEYGRTYRAFATLPDGRAEASYISLGPNSHRATVKTFRP